VASYGADSNSANNCSPTMPCRSFQAALAVVDAGGEIVALDAAGYGPVVIAKAVTITANPGVFAGISVSSGAAVTIAHPAADVTLRGLVITGLGGADGVAMTEGFRLVIENCVISRFTGSGVAIDAATAIVRVADSVFRQNGYGITVARAHADVTRSRFIDHTYDGVLAKTTTYLYDTVVSVSDSVATGNNRAFAAMDAGADGGVVRMSVTRSTASNNVAGIMASRSTPSNTVAMTLSESTVTVNLGGGLTEVGGAIFESLGNNTVRQNNPNASGTISTVAPM